MLSPFIRYTNFRHTSDYLHYFWFQVVTWAVYAYFVACILGRQFLHKTREGHTQQIDIYFPICTVLQFVIYMGWLKVAQVLMNPFGDDEDDFEMNYLIDRNIQVINCLLATISGKSLDVSQYIN